MPLGIDIPEDVMDAFLLEIKRGEQMELIAAKARQGRIYETCLELDKLNPHGTELGMPGPTIDPFLMYRWASIYGKEIWNDEKEMACLLRGSPEFTRPNLRRKVMVPGFGECTCQITKGVAA